MSSGATHAKVAYTMMLPLTGAGIVNGAIYQDWGFGLGLVTGGVAGILVTPDIDHHETTVEEVRFYQVGRVAGVLWQWLWAGYEMFVPHRGISHWPIIGTLTRVLYLAIMGRLALWVVAGMAGDLCSLTGCEVPPMTLGAMWEILVIFHRFWFGVFVGWCTQDLGHILFDLPPLMLAAVLGLIVVLVAVFFFNI